MLQDSSVSDFAEDLVKYSVLSSGYRVTPFGFSNLQPVYYRAMKPDFSLLLHKHYEGAQQVNYTGIDSVSMSSYFNNVPEYTTRFLHQFVRNHFRSLSYIPMIEAGDQNVAGIYYTNLGKDKKITLNSEPYLIHMNSSNKLLNRNGTPPTYVKYKGKNKKWYLFMIDKTTERYNEKGAFISVKYMPVQGLGTYKEASRPHPSIDGITIANGLARGKMITEYQFKSANVHSVFNENLVGDVRLEAYSKMKEKSLNKAPSLTKYRANLRVVGATKYYTEDILDEKLFAEHDYRMLMVGTNAEGIHGKGIALLAKKMGARKGKAEGILDDNAEPKTFGVITKKNFRVERSSSMDEIMNGLKKLYEYARAHPEKEIWIPYKADGENLNGYTPKEMSYMFAEAAAISVDGEKVIDLPANIVFHEYFRDLVLEYANTSYKSDVKSIFKQYQAVLRDKWNITDVNELSMALATDPDLLERIKNC